MARRNKYKKLNKILNKPHELRDYIDTHYFRKQVSLMYNNKEVYCYITGNELDYKYKPPQNKIIAIMAEDLDLDYVARTIFTIDAKLLVKGILAITNIMQFSYPSRTDIYVNAYSSDDDEEYRSYYYKNYKPPVTEETQTIKV